MRFKVGDIVLVSSPAGNIIPPIHVKLLKRVVVEPAKGNRMDWPGYKGWEATTVFQEEVDRHRKEWNIPFQKPGEDKTFVFDDHIIKKPRNPTPGGDFRKKSKRKRKTCDKNVKVIRRRNKSKK